MTEARKADRLRIVLLARYREPTMLDLREAECRDLSLGGMFVATARPSPRGGLIRFECESSTEGESFRGTARVVWQRSKSDPRGAAGMGVRFVHLEPSSREALSRLVARVLQSRSSMPASAEVVKPAGGAAARISAAVEEQASVLPIISFGSTQHGVGPGAGSSASSGGRRSPLHAPTLRGVGSDPEVISSGTRGRLDRGAIRRSAAATELGPEPVLERPEHSPPMVATGGARMRSDPPPNLVSNPDRPRNDRPPGAAAVNDEPAWSMPRERPRSDRPPAPGPVDDDTAAPLARTAGDRPLGATAPGLGAEPVEHPQSDRAAASRTLIETRDSVGAAAAKAASSQPPVRTLIEAQYADATPASPASQTSEPQPRNGAAPERPGRERLSERPPAPGGVDVLRVQSVVRVPSAAIGNSPPLSNGSESAAVWQGQRASTDPGQPPARTSWEPPPNAANRRTVRRAAEEAEILDEPLPVPRLAPARTVAVEDARDVRDARDARDTRVVEPARSWGAIMLWLVVGSGLVVAVVLSKLLGGAPPSIPDSPAATDQTGTFGAQPGTPSLTLPYRLVVLTDPPGAKVTVGGNTLVAPAEFGLPSVEEPVLVSAALDGRMTTSIEISRAEFSATGDHYEHEVTLTLPPLPAAVAEPVPEPSAPAAAAAPSPRVHSGSATAAPQRNATAPVNVPAAAAVPFGAPVLPNRTLAGPPGSAPNAVPAAGDRTSAVGTTGAIPAADATATAGAEDVGKLATDCLRKGDNACVIRLLEPAAHTAQELEMLIETYRALGDQGNAERHMRRYVDGFPNGRRAIEYNRLLAARNPAPAASTAPPSSVSPATPAAATQPASSERTPSVTPSNPPAAPMPPDPPAPH